MIDNAAAMGAYLMDGLRAVASPHVREVRGKGLMIGVELHPEAGGARRFCERLAGVGLLCKETHANVIRFAPPLVIRRQDIDWALDRIAKVLREP
jgi:ornithine--oxo-acid transaminase